MNQEQMFGMTKEGFKALLRQVEDRLGLPDGHIFKIYEDESDWEFITKLSVVIEAAATDTLVAFLRNDKVRSHVGSVGQETRLKLCRQLEILNGDEEKLLKKVNHLRNNFAHRVANIVKSLDDFYAELAEEDRVGFDRAFEPLQFIPGKTQGLRDRIFFRAIQPLFSLGFAGAEADQRRRFAEHAQEVFRQGLMADSPPVTISSKHTRTVFGAD